MYNHLSLKFADIFDEVANKIVWKFGRKMLRNSLVNSFIIEGNMGTSGGPYGVLPYYDSINVPDAAGSIERNEFTWLPILHGKTAKPRRIVFEGNSGRIDKGARDGAAQRSAGVRKRAEGEGGSSLRWMNQSSKPVSAQVVHKYRALS